MKFKKPKKKKKLGSDSKDRIEKRNEDLEVVDITPEDAEEWKDSDTSGEFKIQDGENIILILPPLVKFGVKTPWIETRTHFLGKQFVDLAGIELPEDVPMAHGCGLIHGDGTCAWCTYIAKLKASRSRRDSELAKALRYNVKFVSNVINLRESRDSRVPYFMRYGVKVKEVLHRALKDGEVFCKADALIPVRIIKTGTGMKTRYETKVLTGKPRIKCERSWLETMSDLSTHPNPVASPTEVEEWMRDMFDDYESGGYESVDTESTDDFDF